MLLQDFCKVFVLLFIVFACSSSPTVHVVEDGPKEVVVESLPLPVTLPQEVPVQKVVVSGSVPEVTVIPENKPPVDPTQACLDACESSCSLSAKDSCGEDSGSGCKSKCGVIIDVSACSTACSLRAAHACEPKFLEFCASKCAGQCH